MSNEKSIIEYRLKRSDEAFEEALMLVTAQHWNSVVNRLYYSLFYAVSALLQQEGVFTKTHAGLKSKFNELFVKTFKIGLEKAQIYTTLFSTRQLGDYADFITYTKDEVEPLIERTEELIYEIKKLII